MALPLVGPSQTLAARNPNAERTINFFQETTAPGAPKSPQTLRGTPGCTPFCTTGASSYVRGEFQQDNRAFAVADDLFLEVFVNGSRTIYGSVTDDGNPASICSNGSAGNQLFVVSGGNGYIFDLLTNAFAIIADGDFPANVRMGEFMDGYFLVLKADSRQWYISALEDGTSWDPLDVAERSEGSDNIQALIRNHREIWLIGSKTTEVWYDNGDPLFPFAPIQGVFLETGTSSPWTVARIDNTLAFLNLDERGQGIAYRMDGYTPQRISTYAQEAGLYGWGGSSQLLNAIGFAQQQGGHLFYWLYINDLDTTWVFDVGEKAWHERALWNITTVQWEPYVARCVMFAFDTTLIGDRQSGTIYELSLAVYDDEVVVP
jgi:hypothetical protein